MDGDDWRGLAGADGGGRGQRRVAALAASDRTPMDGSSLEEVARPLGRVLREEEVRDSDGGDVARRRRKMESPRSAHRRTVVAGPGGRRASATTAHTGFGQRRCSGGRTTTTGA
jgi:hypothetical protein